LKNPVTLAERARVRAEKPAILTVAEAPALIENAEADFIPAFALGLFAGLRPESEVWPLDWNQIDFKDKTVDVNRSKNLAGERFVKMSENLIEWLRPQAFPLLLGAWRTIAGDEAIHRIRKDQACCGGCEGRFAPSVYCRYVWIRSLIHSAIAPTSRRFQGCNTTSGWRRRRWEAFAKPKSSSRVYRWWNAGAWRRSPERSGASINGLPLPSGEDQKKKLETLLNVREGTHQTLLTWLRQPAKYSRECDKLVLNSLTAAI
jgi:hypothetical protein